MTMTMTMTMTYSWWQLTLCNSPRTSIAVPLPPHLFHHSRSSTFTSTSFTVPVLPLSLPRNSFAGVVPPLSLPRICIAVPVLPLSLPCTSFAVPILPISLPGTYFAIPVLPISLPRNSSHIVLSTFVKNGKSKSDCLWNLIFFLIPISILFQKCLLIFSRNKATL